MLDIMIHGKDHLLTYYSCYCSTSIDGPHMCCPLCALHNYHLVWWSNILTCQSGIVALCSWELPDSILFRVCTCFDICTAGCHRNENYWWRRKRQPL